RGATTPGFLPPPAAESCVVVDPGYEDEPHLEKVAEAGGRIELILLTHHHPDHAEGGPGLAARTCAPVRALDPARCRGAAPLTDASTSEAAGMSFEVLHTPGHTEDSVC